MSYALDQICPEQVFTYSYLDEQENKKREIAEDPEGKKPFVYREMPDLNLSTIEITDQDIKTQREHFLTDDMDFSLNELFKATNSKFVHDEAVSHFLESLCKREHGATAVSVYGRLGEQLGMPAKRHSVWWLSRVASIRQLIKKLKNHPIFSQYEIINAAGGQSDNDLDDVPFAKGQDDIFEKNRENKLWKNKQGGQHNPYL